MNFWRAFIEQIEMVKNSSHRRDNRRKPLVKNGQVQGLAKDQHYPYSNQHQRVVRHLKCLFHPASAANVAITICFHLSYHITDTHTRWMCWFLHNNIWFWSFSMWLSYLSFQCICFDIFFHLQDDNGIESHDGSPQNVGVDPSLKNKLLEDELVKALEEKNTYKLQLDRCVRECKRNTLCPQNTLTRVVFVFFL